MPPIPAASIAAEDANLQPVPARQLPDHLLHREQVVADLIYRPLVTPLLRAATSRGATPLNGVSMLLYQASRAFRLWTGQDAPVDVMRAALTEALRPGIAAADPSAAG